MLADAGPGKFALWDVATENIRTTFTEQLTVAPAFSPDGKCLATVGKDQIIRVRDTETGAVTASVLLSRSLDLHDFACSVGGQILAGAALENVRLWNTRTGKTRDLEVYAVSLWLSPDSSTLALVNGRLEIELWDVNTGKQRSTLPVRSARSVAFAPDGRTLATSQSDGTVKLWDLRIGLEQATYQAGPAGGVLKFSPDGSILGLSYGLATSYPNLPDWLQVLGVPRNLDRSATVLINVSDGQKLTTLRGRGHIGFWPDAKTLVTWDFSGHCLEMWDLPPSRAVHPVLILPALGLAIGLSSAWWYTGRRRLNVDAGNDLCPFVAEAARG
jgi:WD40 repeat protein